MVFRLLEAIFQLSFDGDVTLVEDAVRIGMFLDEVGNRRLSCGFINIQYGYLLESNVFNSVIPRDTVPFL